MSRYLSFRDGGKTDQVGISRYLGKIFEGNVINGLAVTQQGPLALGVAVSAGDIFIPSANDHPYIGWSDASINVSLSTADGSNPRYDLIVAYVDLSVVSSTNPNNPNALVIDNVTGTPAGSPVEPNLTAIEAVIGVGNPYVVLARVTVGAGVTTISNSVIVDRRDMLSLDIPTEETSTGGWIDLDATLSVSSGYNKGNKEFDLASSADLTGILQPGHRLKVSRNTAPPTQCTDLENTSSQYADRASGSVTGITFTDDFTVEAWIKLESYGINTILGRYNGTSGWEVRVGALGQSDGRLQITGYNGGSGNFSTSVSYQSVPLNKWVHVVMTLDMSTFTAAGSPMYIDGVLVPSFVQRGGTNPTALVQAGNLSIGAANTASFFDGKISDVRIWNVVRTALQIQNNMNQQLVGNETNLVGYWKLNGNFNDSHANANNLTAQGGATATNVDNPLKSTEYAIVMKVTSTIVTVFTGTDYNIPNMTLNNPAYSLIQQPFGFPNDKGRWSVRCIVTANETIALGAIAQWHSWSAYLTVPTGAWNVGYQTTPQIHSTVSGSRIGHVGLFGTVTNPSVNAVYKNPTVEMIPYQPAASDAIGGLTAFMPVDLTAAEIFRFKVSIAAATGTETAIHPYNNAYGELIAECAYV